MANPYSIPDITELREMVGVVPQPFATSPSGRGAIVDDPSPEFSSTATYRKGETVWKDQHKYRAKDDVAAHAWTAAEWDEVKDSGVTYQHGFTPEYSSPLPDGKVITRRILNAIGNIGSQCQFFEQCGGFYTFDEKVSKSIGGYPQGAFLQYYDADAKELRTVRSLADNNENNFVADPSLIDGNPNVGKWAYADNNPPVGIDIDYSSYEDLSETLFVGTGIPDLYEVPYDSYLQLFAVGTLDCESLRRDSAEDCTIYFKDSSGNRTYRQLNGMYFTDGTGSSFLDIYNQESQNFGSVVLGGWRPYSWVYWDANYENKLHLEKICPISPFSCGVMLSKGDKIRIRNSVKDTPFKAVSEEGGTTTQWPKGVVHERMFSDDALRRKYLVRFANLYKRGVRA